MKAYELPSEQAYASFGRFVSERLNELLQDEPKKARLLLETMFPRELDDRLPYPHQAFTVSAQVRAIRLALPHVTDAEARAFLKGEVSL